MSKVVVLCSTLRLDNATACALEVSTTTRTARSDAPRGVRAVALTGAARPLEVDFGSVAPSGAFLSAGTATVPARGEARVISDCHFSVQLNHFIPGFLSYSVPVFLK